MCAAMFCDPNEPERVFGEFEQIGTARAAGRELWGQVGCFPLGMEFTLAEPYPLHALKTWKPAIDVQGSGEPYAALLRDPGFRDQVRAELSSTGGVPNRFSSKTFENMRLIQAQQPDHESMVADGLTVAEMAAAQGAEPMEWLLDLVTDGGEMAGM